MTPRKKEPDEKAREQAKLTRQTDLARRRLTPEERLAEIGLTTLGLGATATASVAAGVGAAAIVQRARGVLGALIKSGRVLSRGE